MKWIKGLWDFISGRLFEVIGVLGLFIMLVIAFGNVVSRYLLPTSGALTEGLTCGLFILVSLLGAALGVKDGKAMGISIVTDLLPARCQKYITIIQGLFTGIFGFLLLYYGIEMVQSELRLNMRTAAIFGSFVPIGGAALMVGAVCLIIKGIKEIREDHGKKEGEK